MKNQKSSDYFEMEWNNRGMKFKKMTNYYNLYLFFNVNLANRRRE